MPFFLQLFVVFVGTRTGELLVINVEKGSCHSVWNGSDERLDDCDDGDSQDGEHCISIRRISWLAPQTSTTDGCLFVLLGKGNKYTSFALFFFSLLNEISFVYMKIIASHGVDNDNLKNVVFGFTPTNNHSKWLLLQFV